MICSTAFDGLYYRSFNLRTAREVKSRYCKGIQFRYPLVARGLSSLLLAFILYGSTVESAHRHGRILSTNERQSSSSVSNPSHLNQDVSGTISCSDCLICQLHQGFSSAQGNYFLLDTPTLTKAPASYRDVVAFQSEYRTPRRGRAPPSIS